MELVSERITPYLRGLVALELWERGYSQLSISRLLSLSQPMVHRYLKQGKAYFLGKLGEAGIEEAEARSIAFSIASRLAEDRLSGLRLLALVELSILSRAVPCNLYRGLVDVEGDPCQLFEIYQSPYDPYVVEAEEFYRRISRIEGIHRLLPEVGSNIVVAAPGARSHWEVVAYPGRIVKAGPGIYAVGKPVYGGSRHTARVLLEAMSRWPWLRVAFVARRVESIVSALSGAGGYCRVEEYGSWEEFYANLGKAIREARGECRVIDDLGGKGFEPVIYLLSEDASQLAAEVERLASLAAREEGS